MPWWVLISAVVHTGSMILRSECRAALSTVSAAAGGASARVVKAAVASARRQPEAALLMIMRKLHVCPDRRAGCREDCREHRRRPAPAQSRGGRRGALDRRAASCD